MITMAKVVQEVAKTYGVTADELLGESQAFRVTEPRHVAMYLCRRQVPRASFANIARKFGRVNGTVRAAVALVERRRSSPLVNDAVTRLEQALSNTPKTDANPEETAHVR